MHDVTVVGPLNVDILVRGEAPPYLAVLAGWEGPAAVELAVAGSVGYTVQDLARLGLDVSVSGCVADDVFGPVILRQLNENGVGTDWVDTIKGTTSGIGVYVLAFGSKKRPLFYQLPTHDPWPRRFEKGRVDQLLDARLLHNGGFLHFQQMYESDIVGLFRKARARGLITCVDTQFPLHALKPPWMQVMLEVLRSIDFLFCDEHEARGLTGIEAADGAARILLDAGSHTVVIKHGTQGSDVFQKGWHHHEPAIHVSEVVDSIGAGDAYDAGFIAGLLEKRPLPDCARMGSICASRTLTAAGGWAGMPDRAALGKLLSQE
jgi:sugar/nucleoside kinase (ribokinase family)